MASFLSDYAKKNVEKLIDGALKELRYICCFTCIAKEFEEKKVRLEAERTSVGQRVQVAKRRGEDVQATALFWEDEADKIIQEDTKTKQKCFFGLCPDCIWLYKRGKELEIKKEQISFFMETGKELAIGLPAPLPDVERYSSRHYISFKSRESKYNELLDALKDENNYIIGLQGMGGTGKTTLSKEVGKILKQSRQFTCIIVTTVSFSPDIKKIQDDIAGPLGLKFDDCSESDRPKKLWKRLTNGEKILVILDDVWGDIDFEEIGIPYSDNHKGCRVLVTTRNVEVCNTLGCSKTIRLELLSSDDAWEMFKRHAGLTETSTRSLLDKGRKIADECKGLPIAIAVIASSLRGKQHREEWDFALKSLQKYASMHDIDDDDDDLVKIYERLKFSYDNMNDGKAKRLFLLCSVFREDEEIPTESLIRLGIGAGLFGEDYGSYEDARSQVVISKNKLLDSCLLLEVDDDRVKMHDLVRDAAQWIANKEIQTVKLYDKNKKRMVEREKSIKYLLCEGKLKDVILCKLESSKLQILIVNIDSDDDDRHKEKIEVPNSFFKNISGLRVFHFSSYIYPTNLSLPHSIQLLKNIRSLLFHGFDLGDISILGNLQSLETLDLGMCEINEFPEGMAKLPNLRLLSLRFCEIRRNNPFKVIEGCSSLEELYFITSFNDCCREISFPLLQRFIVDDGYTNENVSVSKYLSLLDKKDKYLLPKKQFKDCIQAVEVLRLTDGIWWEWVNIIPEIVPMDYGMNDLVELKLSCIPKLKCLIDTKHGNSQVTTVFSKLVILHLDEMESLVELCNGPLSFDSLKSLEELTIISCDQLQSLFTCSLNLFNLKTLLLLQCPMLIFSLFQLTTSGSLVSLEVLRITGCKHLEYIIIDERKVKESRGEIVAADDDNDRKMSQDSIFPKLKHLYIEHCHGLKFIFSIQDLPALDFFSISDCEKLQSIFGHDSINNFLKCDVTTPSPISRDASKPGKQLEPLKCSTFSWTNICCFGKKSRTTEDQQQDLPSKTTSLLENSISLNYLTVIKIRRCKKLEIVFSTSILRCLPQLVALRIVECKELKHIIEDDLENDKSINFESTNTYFPKLEILIVGNCNKLKCVFPTSVCKKLPKLKVLIIREAYGLQQIFKTEGDDQKLEIPNLGVVSFINLPNLSDAQKVHFEAVNYRFLHSCHKLSLTSASKSDTIDNIIDPLFDIDSDIYMELMVLLQSQPLKEAYKGHHTWNQSPTSEITREFADGVGIEAEAALGHILTSPQMLLNEQSMDQQLLTNKQHSLGETETTNKPQLDGSVTPPEKTLAANSSIISETKKEQPIQLLGPKQMEDVDCQIATTSLSSVTTENNDEGEESLNIFLETNDEGEDSLIKLSETNDEVSEDSSQIDENLSELEQLASKKHLNDENLCLLNDFLAKHPCVRLRDTSLSNRYKGYAYNLLAELLKFLQRHSLVDVLGSSRSELFELLQDVRSFAFDKDWLDGVERRIIQQEGVLNAPIGY
ncbi:probable disease resistance protein At4g27220 isoform X2 [Lathyrus oleraceus]|uniref:probable disease resistance protein At4g27220 isoform X2 n=1 Tax=Pisum sativum TaxID=3888 RepID=UPI0021CE9832|nr:probable disease resistance protein At4g27220 isoform X2 [Pisum sativum]